MTGESHRELTGKVALVVGGTRNIGAALAGALAAQGADVAVSFAHHKDAAELTVERLRDLGVAAEAFRADATKAADTTRLFDQAVDRFGGLDIVVHVPGAVLKRPLVEVTDEEYDTGMGYNSRSAFLTLREAGRRIADHGRIILVSTSLTVISTGLYGAYASGKAAAEQMVRSLSHEVGGRHVTVNAVAPGPVDTPFFHAQETPESVEYVRNAVPARRLGRPEDIAPVVAFLASEGARWVTGQTIFVNGGLY